MDDQQPFSCAAGKRIAVSEVQKHFPRREAVRDPRFDPTLEFNARAFRNSYAFIADLREKENAGLEDSLKTAPDDQRGAIVRRILQNKQKIGGQRTHERERVLRKEIKEAELQAVKQGKQPFYMRERDVREVVRAQRFTEQAASKKQRYIQRQYER